MPNDPSRDGYPVVLTADRTLMAGYRTLFDGMTACAQTTTTPGIVMRAVLARRVPSEGPLAWLAPLGLRRIEAALLGGGFAPDEVAVSPPERLSAAVGPETRVVGVSTGDPLGRGMNSGTMEGIAGGTSYPTAYFRKVMRRLAKLRRAGASFRLVVGGPGAWQLADDEKSREELGVDCVVCGYAEGLAPGLFRRLVDGGEAPAVSYAAPGADIPRIRGGSVMGVVEISRGCGKGCSFCSIKAEPMRHISPDHVVADMETNLAAGHKNVAAISEDFFRYGAENGAWTATGKLAALLLEARRLSGIRTIQIDHANVASVAETPDDALRELRGLLVGETGQRRPWLNLGVETVSGELLAANGGAAKIRPHRPEDWGEVAFEQTMRLAETGYFPMVSLIMGLPGETEEHFEQAARWVDRLGEAAVSVFPMFLAPLDGGPAFGTKDMTHAHWRLFRRCYRRNFRWVPRALWDSQTSAGEALWRRALLQAMGLGNVALWKVLLAVRPYLR